jgi:hypothetical protein
LLRQAGEREITAAEVPDARVVEVVAETKVQLCMKRMAEKKFRDELA